ncbi:protein lifeguard 4-like [Trichogramma pretiosum]|uniref:protein lifeguard 4-like n=1 Tax=Trichogramma pretiosum TaxID=7493 RepID=UPI0006C954D4|nr:protein lifeguard 4-like [Trichogramma pretiosum]XP_014228407.1 protein lifeguard 4-like [Trichogramma pretiosum]
MMNHEQMASPLLFSDDDIETGGKEGQENIENDFAYRNNVQNASVKIRMAFIRKVYSLLSVQLLMTVIIGSIFCMVSPVKLYVSQNVWPVMVSFFLTFGILIALHFKRKEHPTNLILLACFTMVQAFTIGIVVSLYDVVLVIEALFITLAVVIALTAFTFQTKRDFSSMGAALFSLLCVLIIGGILQIFIQSSAMELLICVGGALLFSLFIIFDTQLIMKTLSPEEYILATINIYMDILNLFLYILRILEMARK